MKPRKRRLWSDHWDDYDERLRVLPRWAQQMIAGLRHEITRLREGVIEKAEHEGRVYLTVGGDGAGGYNVRPLDDASEVVFQVTGGEMHVRLRRFGARYTVEVMGWGTWDPATQERHEIAVLPAMSNVVNVGFVMPARLTLEQRAIDPGTSLDDLEPAPGTPGLPITS